MARHLPPKIPTTNSPPTNLHPSPPHPPWIHEFLGFSTAKRVSHRRAVSDSASFFDPATPQPSTSPDFDDEQLLSMLSDDVPPPSPSDHNSINDDDGPNSSPPSSSDPPFRSAHDQWEAQSSCNADPPPPASEKDSAPQPILHDHKRVKRILANRQSAQRSRVRKLHYISELERSVATLQTEVSVLSPRVAFYDHQRSVLSVGNSHLKQRIAALAQDNIFKDAHQEVLKKEIERLRQIYHQQSLKRMAATATADGGGAAAVDQKELQSNY